MPDTSRETNLRASSKPAARNDAVDYDEAEVFANALDLVDVQARSRYLEQALGNNTVRRKRLARLLDYAVQTSEFLEPSLLESPSAEAHRIESVGDWLGPYRLLEQIGEGGMGAVYMAEQVTPLRRRVAIKVIKPGMDSSQVLARFEAERQVLAMMDHPNIARAVDVGVSEHGRTYFVMELVKGVPITRYCDDLRLSPRQRLELFVPVCLAIQHAHQKGIIHRDLKPSNILVAEYDGVAVPKVIDFGVAKALNQPLTCKTLFTQFGQIVGTMEYMSPEQSRVNQLDIDTRSDIYSLGVLLYELITGTTPIQSQLIKELGWDELVRMIREEDAPAPSQRLSTIERIQWVAQQRNTEPTKLNGFVKGELDWIVLKSLDKQRARRYQNATELAEDVRRFLQGQEVLACPPSTTYRLRKYVQKHRTSVLATGLVSMALLMGIAGTSWQAWNASVARHQAEGQRDIAHAEAMRAQRARTEAQSEAAKAMKEAEITRAVSSFVNNDLIAFANPNLEPDRNLSLRTVVDRASEKVAALQAAPLVEASIRYTLAKSYLGLGEYHLALQHAEKSSTIRSDSLPHTDPLIVESLLLLAEAQLKLSRLQQASATYAKALELIRQSPDTNNVLLLDCQNGYGIALARLGELDVALETLTNVAERRQRILGATHVQSMETNREIAEVLFKKGEYLEATKSFANAIETMTEHLGESHPLTLRTMAGAANVACELGETSNARLTREFILEQQVRVLGEDHPDALLTASDLSLVSQRTLEPEAAIAKNRELLRTARERLGVSNMVTLNIASSLAGLLTELGRTTEATTHLEECQMALRELHQGLSPELLRTNCQIAGCLAFEGKYKESLTMYRQTLHDQRELLSAHHLDTLMTELGYAQTLMSSGSFQEAEECLSSLIASAVHSDLKNHPIIQHAESKLATLESALGRTSSLERHQAARTDARRKYGSESTIRLQMDVAFAESLLRFGRNLEAKQVLDEGLTIIDAVYGETHIIRGQLQAALVEALSGVEDWGQAIQLAEELLEQRKRAFGIQHPLTLHSLNQLGAVLVRSGNPLRGVVFIREAVEESKKCLGQEFPTTLTYQQNLASTLGLIAINDRAQRRESLRLFEELLAIQAGWGEDHPDGLFSRLGYAGALAQQGRFLEAEQVFETLLPKFLMIYGDAHPLSLRCRENYSSVLGSLGKYELALQQCRDCIRAHASASPASRKVTHAAIEYHINSAKVLDALDLYQSAAKMASEPGVELDWLFLDIPYFVDAHVNAGEYDRAEEILEWAIVLFTTKLGAEHAKTRFLKAKLLSLLYQKGSEEEVKSMLVELANQPNGERETSPPAISKLFADIAKEWESDQGLHMAALYGMAAQLEQSQRPDHHPESDHKYSILVDQSSDEAIVDYQMLAIQTLAACASEGLLRTPRAQHWLKYSPDIEGLRQRNEFKQIVAEVDKSTLIENTLRMAWNLALVDNHLEAARMLRSLAQDYPELAELGAVQYMTARAWASCYDAANRLSLDRLAAEYLACCQMSLEYCKRVGYFTGGEMSMRLANDDSFSGVREKLLHDDR